MSNLNMTMGKKQWLITLPIMLLGFLPLIMMTCFKGDITKELSLSEIDRKVSDGNIEITGLITSSGRHDWSGITIEAEFYDGAGKFIDESSEYLSSDVKAGVKERFKIKISSPTAAVKAPETKMIVKISGGNTSLF